MMPTTTKSPRLSAIEAFAEIARLRIAITRTFDGRVWLASVEVEGAGSGRRAMRVVSALGSTPIAAVDALIAKLDGPAQPVALFQEDDAPW